MTSDEQLMLEFQQGSKAAFTELFARYRERIYGFFRRRLTTPARAEDLTQEAFLGVLRAVTRYEPRSLFRTYLYGIAMNLLHAERRRDSRESAADGNPTEPAADRTDDTSLHVRHALGRLDADDREILMLREYEELSYEEIATLQRVPVNTVRSRLFRARMALKEILQGQLPAAAGASKAGPQ